VLFTILATTGGLNAASVAVLDLRTGAHTIIIRGGSHAHYVRSGHLVFAAAFRPDYPSDSRSARSLSRPVARSTACSSKMLTGCR